MGTLLYDTLFDKNVLSKSVSEEKRPHFLLSYSEMRVI